MRNHAWTMLVVAGTLAACSDGKQAGSGAAPAGGGGEVVMTRDAAVGAPYRSTGPRSCGDRKTPANGPLTQAQATAYVICGQEKESANTLQLVGGITVAEVSAPRPYSDRQDNNMPDVGVTKPVQSIRGKMLVYTCWQVMTGGDYIARHRQGTNCMVSDHPDAKGICYQNMMGQWSCSFYDFNARTGFKAELPPPA